MIFTRRRTALNTARAVFVAAVTAAAVTVSTIAPASAAQMTTASAVTLANEAGFAHIAPARLTTTAPATAALLTPSLAVILPAATTAVTDGQVVINGPAADGTSTVVRVGGFGVVTNRHDVLDYKYQAVTPAGVSIVKAADGGLDEKSPAGTTIAHLDAATAVDSSGAAIPASYDYDNATHRLVVRADTTHAHGAVFIDPSWHCMLVAGAYGLGALVVAVAWLFTDGTVAWVAWALRVWFGVSVNAANAIARACVS